jgi:hypothetical protein
MEPFKVKATPTKITLPFADLEGQETLEKRTHYLELHENHIHWVYEAWVNYQEDEDEPWHERLLAYDWTFKKESVNMVELSYSEEPAYWRIIIWVAGSESDINIYYKKEENARELINVLNNYFFNTP